MVDRGQRRISGIAATKEYREYLTRLKDPLHDLIAIARRCRSRGLDPSTVPEVSIAWDMAERVERLTGPKGVAKRIRALGDKMTRIQVAFQIAQEIIYGKFGYFPEQEGARQALRTALAVINGGVTVAPIQGIFDVKIKQNPDGTQYLSIYFAGPMRAAGGTAQAIIIVLADFIRKLLHLDRYKPDPREIRRFIEEVRIYERGIGRLQFRVTDEVLAEVLRSLPVEVTGIGVGPEIASFRDFPRIETSRIRAGAIRVINDGVVGRAAKALRVIEEMGIDGWEWLESVRAHSIATITAIEEKEIIGRPFLSTSSKRSGFRLRYGRARNSGLGAVGVHPATMILLDNFLAVGTQLRLDCPGKSAIVVPVDSIEGPVVKLHDGSVVRLTEQEEAQRLAGKVKQILFLGDILVAYGEFLFNNRRLLPSSFTSEWWAEMLRDSIKATLGGSIERASLEVGIPEERLRAFIRHPLLAGPTVEESLVLARRFGVPLHPRHTFFWGNISKEELASLRAWLVRARNTDDGFIVPARDEKLMLEKLCVPHTVKDGKIIIPREEADILTVCLALSKPNARVEGETVFEVVSNMSGIVVEDVVRSFIGARMGRPEKAEKVSMPLTAHVLFPVGSAGGTHRDIIRASKGGSIVVGIANFICPRCGGRSLVTRCPVCKVKTSIEMQCPNCGSTSIESNVCPLCGSEMQAFRNRSIELGRLLLAVSDQLGFLPSTLRGVRELTSKVKVAENLAKGVLRAKYGLSVFKDGCVRFNATNAPLTHFKPSEVGTPVEKLKELGYEHDRFGKPLHREDQVCELKAQDVILPERCGEYLLSVANFIDELLARVYGLPPFYRSKSKEDLVGHLIVGISPHTSCCVLGRIIGFTRASVCYANPLWHAAKRRDCDGDEDSVMLALDVLLNFSKSYLPDKIGGLMGAPLLLIPMVDPAEVDEEVYCMDVVRRYPGEFYKGTLESYDPGKVTKLVETLRDRVGRKGQF
ncbi:TPA: DNA polymerase II large subunit, partial [Candidatus Bathyarchaeota archaeon]|nr:DNA polymerase II large subunit [Candidatus Bathyarchaeota archaeon]